MKLSDVKSGQYILCVDFEQNKFLSRIDDMDEYLGFIVLTEIFNSRGSNLPATRKYFRDWKSWQLLQTFDELPKEFLI